MHSLINWSVPQDTNPTSEKRWRTDEAHVQLARSFHPVDNLHTRLFEPEVPSPTRPKYISVSAESVSDLS